MTPLQDPSESSGLHPLMAGVVVTVLLAGCLVEERRTSPEEIVVDGVPHDVRAVLNISAGEGAWAARLDVPANGARLVAVLDIPLRAEWEGSAFLAVLDGSQLVVKGDLFRCEAESSIRVPEASGGDNASSHFQVAAIHDLQPGTPIVIVAWTGVTGNGSVRVAVSSGVPVTDFGQARGAASFQPSTMGDPMPGLQSGALDQHLAGPTLFWGDFAVDRFESGDVLASADGKTHSGHVDPAPLPSVTSYAGIWAATDLHLSYQVVGPAQGSGLYGALIALPEGLPAPGWLEAVRGWCSPD